MEPKAKHILIGSFTVGVIILAMLMVLFFSHGFEHKASRYYTVIFNDGVSGLSRGSAVEYSGLSVGEVVRLSLDPHQPNRVVAKIRLPADVTVYSGVKARLTIKGVTGLAVISLKGGDTTSAPIEGAKDIDDPAPEIVAIESSLAALINNGQDLMQNLTQLSVNVNKLFSPNNIQSFNQTLENIEKISHAVSNVLDPEFEQKFSGLMDSINNTMSSLEQISKEVNHFAQQGGKSLLKDAQQAIDNINQTSLVIRQLFEDNQYAVTQGTKGIARIAPALKSFEDAMVTMKSILQDLKDKPLQYMIEGQNLKEYRP
ncbi:MlaD family protein [Basilea psittacipulmonis]|uniref:Mce/MlaD domain-containing protein n=1 Tax=Basilea psittacipulmonis DSM 24701 TaxID=1072685 RepID=A0A077DC69_9BURK|nr:MlaD family protein [Basilea psittacipulmonis]AIL32480.1 hypothetical protein IX83_03410 [Basilea psittacipulmonis DSM 24701]